jgi:hypothetical protein
MPLQPDNPDGSVRGGGGEDSEDEQGGGDDDGEGVDLQLDGFDDGNGVRHPFYISCLAK